MRKNGAALRRRNTFHRPVSPSQGLALLSSPLLSQSQARAHQFGQTPARFKRSTILNVPGNALGKVGVHLGNIFR